MKESPLATEYGQPYLVCLVKNVHLVYAFWEITESQLHVAFEQVGSDQDVRKVIRVFKETENQQQILCDFTIEANVGSHYLYLPTPGSRYRLELMLVSSNRAVSLISSNFVSTPYGQISENEDEEWLSIDELYQSFTKELVKYNHSSPATWNITSPMGQPESPIDIDELNLVVDTEVILYGKSTPGATVKVQGETIKTETDGTFSLRYALPEGCSIYPIKAISVNGTKTRTIVPVITRESY